MNSQKPDLSASIATNGTTVQAEPLPDYTTATNADADAGVESHIPTVAIATTALDPILAAFNFGFIQITQGKNDNSFLFSISH